jgi:hypothetical protein
MRTVSLTPISKIERSRLVRLHCFVYVHAVQKNTEALVAAAKEIGLEVNADKTKYMVMSRE